MNSKRKHLKPEITVDVLQVTSKHILTKEGNIDYEDTDVLSSSSLKGEHSEKRYLINKFSKYWVNKLDKKRVTGETNSRQLINNFKKKRALTYSERRL